MEILLKALEGRSTLVHRCIHTETLQFYFAGYQFHMEIEGEQYRRGCLTGSLDFSSSYTRVQPKELTLFFAAKYL